jgi:hypothetical protein
MLLAPCAILSPLHLANFVSLGPTWSLNLYGGTLGLADQRAAVGEVTEIFPFFTSASGSPTICHTFFPPLSSSISVTVAPEFDGVSGKLRYIDDFGTRELVF